MKKPVSLVRHFKRLSLAELKYACDEVLVQSKLTNGFRLSELCGDDGGYLCYYKNVASDNPITYLCNIGCCPNGCCVFQEVKRSGSYDLMIILLLIFVSAILFTAIAMLVIYYIYNRKSDERGYEFNGSFTEDSVVGSQVSGPPTYVGERRYLPHISPMKLF
uniref:CX domain-containing protein n=1 Tax=Loa loa TaxID=7209 RepID=A0A1I7VYV1_LOALO